MRRDSAVSRRRLAAASNSRRDWPPGVKRVIPINMSSQPAKLSLWAGTVRVVLCAMLGAIAVSVVPLIPVFLPEFGKGSTAESGGVQTLVYFGLMPCENIFHGPWGSIGALAGAGIGWLTLRVRRVQADRKAQE